MAAGVKRQDWRLQLAVVQPTQPVAVVSPAARQRGIWVRCPAARRSSLRQRHHRHRPKPPHPPTMLAPRSRGVAAAGVGAGGAAAAPASAAGEPEAPAAAAGPDIGGQEVRLHCGSGTNSPTAAWTMIAGARLCTLAALCLAVAGLGGSAVHGERGLWG